MKWGSVSYGPRALGSCENFSSFPGDRFRDLRDTEERKLARREDMGDCSIVFTSIKLPSFILGSWQHLLTLQVGGVWSDYDTLTGGF